MIRVRKLAGTRHRQREAAAIHVHPDLVRKSGWSDGSREEPFALETSYILGRLVL